MPDKDRIDVDLNLISEGAEEALRDLTKAVGQVGTFLDEVKTTFNSFSMAQGQANLADQFKGREASREAPQVTGDNASHAGKQQDEARASGQANPTGHVSNAGQDQEDSQRSNLSRSSKLEEQRKVLLANHPNPTIQKREDVLSTQERNLDRPIQIPQYGSVKPDEILRRIGDLSFKRGQNTGEESEKEGGKYTKAGIGMHQLASGVARTSVGWHSIKAVGAQFGLEPDITKNTDAGLAAGYAPGSDAKLFGIGMRFPNFKKDGAAREGFRQQGTSIMIGARPGISMGQANQIVGGLAANGFTGESKGSMIAKDYIAPLVQEGLDPTVAVTMFTKGIRNANTSMDDMRAALSGMGQEARGVKMSLGEYSKAIDSFSESMQKGGALYGPAVKSARVISSAEGITPQQSQQAQQSPFTQMGAQIVSHGTVLPGTEGGVFAADPEFALDATFKGQHLADSMSTTLHAPLGEDGKPTMSQRAYRDVYGAGQTGESAETFRALRVNEKSIRQAGSAISDINRVSDNTRNITRALSKKGAKLDSKGNLKTKDGHVEMNEQGEGGHIIDGRFLNKTELETLARGQSVAARTISKETPHSPKEQKTAGGDRYLSVMDVSDARTAQAKKFLAGPSFQKKADELYKLIGHSTDKNHPGFDTIEKEIAGIAPKGDKGWDRQIKRINKMPDSAEKAQQLKRLVSRRQQHLSGKGKEDGIEISLKGNAKEIFKLSDKGKKMLKDESNSGSGDVGSSSVNVAPPPGSPQYSSGPPDTQGSSTSRALPSSSGDKMAG